MGKKWKNNSNAERHYTGKFYRPFINMDDPVESYPVGRIWVRIFPTGAEFRYPNGHTTDIARFGIVSKFRSNDWLLKISK